MPEPKPPHAHRPPSGFTLVEILVVIAIVGILMAVLIPAINAARLNVLTGSLRAQCGAFGQAIDSYRSRYGDYPPDFSNIRLAERHYRRIFPEILEDELTLLKKLCDDTADTANASVGAHVPCVLDRAEALVWAVGGFSSDAQRPFTGVGGPLSLIPGGTAYDPSNYQYNVARDNSLMKLDAGYLSVAELPSLNSGISVSNRTLSSDEDAVPTSSSAIHKVRDVFPVYRSNPEDAPFVYFDSRSYADQGTALVVATTTDPVQRLNLANGFASQLDSDIDIIRPVYSDTVDTNFAQPADSGSATNYGDIATVKRAWRFMNADTFQIHSPGLDGRYGSIGVISNNGSADAGSLRPAFWQYPTGKLVVANEAATRPVEMISPKVSQYNSSSINPPETPEKDNVASFTDRSFADDLP